MHNWALFFAGLLVGAWAGGGYYLFTIGFRRLRKRYDVYVLQDGKPDALSAVRLSRKEADSQAAAMNKDFLMYKLLAAEWPASMLAIVREHEE